MYVVWKSFPHVCRCLGLSLVAWSAISLGVCFAQEEAPPPAAGSEPPAAPATAEVPAPAATEEPQAEATGKEDINMLKLLYDGGALMIPIGLMSLLVGIFGCERMLALRRSRVIPQGLIAELGELANRKGGLDPRLAYRVCQKYRCTASVVIRAALLKVGRPHTEVEKAVAEASEREATVLYKNVRPISLAMNITPLMGLLGTVWGMIQAFHITAQSVTGAKASELAKGIYVALVTTLGGLSVAIIAAILAHYFEGRIQAMFREIEDLLQSLLPQLERYEGKLRMSRWEVGAEPEPIASSETNHSPPNPAPASGK